MIRELVVPTTKYINIQIPYEYIGKKVEIIVFRSDEVLSKCDKNRDSQMLVDEFNKLSKNISTISKDIDILKLDEDMNSDIF